jgi:lipopolysaccharide/colanic/teichoic acid biosynthesis glycosyltransferase
LALRDNLEVSSERLQALLPYLGMTLLVATAVLVTAGLNRAFWRFTAMTDYLRVLASVVAIVLGTVSLSFLADRLEPVPRALPVMQGMLMAFLLIGARVAIRLHHARRRTIELPAAVVDTTAQVETVLVVGLNPITDLFLRSVAEFAPERIKVAGIVGRHDRHSGRQLHQCRILGVPQQIEDILKTLEIHGVSIDRIVVTTRFSDLSVLAQQSLLDVEKRTDIRLDFFAERMGLDDGYRRQPPTFAQPEAKPIVGQAIVAASAGELQTLAERPYFRIKRVADIVLAAALTVVAMPLILMVALVAAMDVGLPMIFWQQRPGKAGRPFKLYKFRSMRSAHDRNGARIPDDERLSPVGNLLRRTRLDELPQLYNILCGDMSFVGPRPLLPVDQAASSAARLLVRPGLTGWAQVAGGREVSASDKAALDIWYVRNASLRVDLMVIARTLPMVVFGERLNARAVQQAIRELEPAHAGSAQAPRATGRAGATPHAA